ncbi:MAG: hypothetical protein LBK55_10380 [Azoarcus sp.]|jgi:hypothetical protein|nr:hypothetical protein [Azoarcus sp.]
MNRMPLKVPVKYWRAALAEAGLYEPKIPPEDKPILIGEVDGQWRIVAAAPDVGKWTTQRFSETKKKGKKDDEQPKTIPLVLIPARLSDKASHGAKQDAEDIHEGYAVLCIPCLLDGEGRLLPDLDRHPWIPRDFLEPSPNELTVGLLADYDEFISGLPCVSTTLDDTFQYAAALFEKVTGACLPLLRPWGNEETPDLDLDDYRLVSEWHGLADDPAVIARHVIRLYDNIEESGVSLPLFDKLRAMKASKARQALPTADSEKRYAEIVGHVSHLYPLSRTQRMAMVELAELGEGKILAVNGPPGTGKTTLLHSVVAQMWVDAALREDDCPLIVVTSTNKKAVENVLESFGKICAETGHARWLPYDRGFGVFLASVSTESLFPTCNSNTHPFVEFETELAVEEAEKSYLVHASQEFDREIDSVKEAVHALHNRLRMEADRIAAIVSARFRVFRATGHELGEGAATASRRMLERLQDLLDVEQAKIGRADEALARCKEDADPVERETAAQWEKIAAAEKQWNSYLAHFPLWLDLLSFLPPLRRRREALDRGFFLSNPILEELRQRDEVEPLFHNLREEAKQHRGVRLNKIDERRVGIERAKAASCKRHGEFERQRDGIRDVFQHWCDVLETGIGGKIDVDVTLDKLNDAIDTGVRAKMFCYADWYWSGRWLLEMRERLQNEEKDTRGFKRLQAKYRRFAKLSPCLVSNLHMAPYFFMAWEGVDKPFWNLIDLLIVDEAGQVSPEMGAGMFALAKRALVVGDTHQIEPVWNIGEKSDRANAEEAGLIPQLDYDDLAQNGYAPARGNLMRIASCGCDVRQYEEDKGIPGLMLIEHRRCVPELIGYCNELIYGGLLEPLRKGIDPADRILPPFGYLNVESEDKKSGPSRCNDEEAEAIVQWLKNNRARIEAHYDGKPLWKLLGVVTPFSAQARCIERHMRQEMPDLMKKESRLTIGTVHKLQGAERPIVIFSATYGASHAGSAFFNRSPNMLNVAVSRAKDSFLVIGNVQNKTLFDARRRDIPSGLLAQYLFERECGSELPGVIADSSPVSGVRDKSPEKYRNSSRN